MIVKSIGIRSEQREEMIDITGEITEFINTSQVREGLLTVFIPHTTAAVTVNENADPDVRSDITNFLKKLIPVRSGFKHLEGNADAHIKSTLVGCSQILLIQNGHLVLGTWQGVFFCEFDGPRQRRAILSIQAC